MPYRLPKSVIQAVNKWMADAIAEHDAIAETASSIELDVLEAAARKFRVPVAALQAAKIGLGKSRGRYAQLGWWAAPVKAESDVVLSDDDLQEAKDTFGE